MTFTLPSKGNPTDVPYASLMPGVNQPYGSLNAQILDALRYSGTLPGRPVNPFGGNNVDRYKFGLLGGGPGFGNPGGPPGGGYPPPGGPPPGPGAGPGNPPPGGPPPGGAPDPNAPSTVQAGSPTDPVGGNYGPYTPNHAPGLLNNVPGQGSPTPSGIAAAIAQFRAQGNNAQADVLAKIYGGAGAPGAVQANPNAALSHGGANAGYYKDASGNYLTGNGYGYGSGKAGTPNAAGVFSTDNGQFPGLGPQGQVATRVGPGMYQYLNISGSNPTWGR